MLDSYTNTNLVLNFNKLSYTLSYENINKKYLNGNSLLFNIEDTNTLYNVFQENIEPISYHRNNILYINHDNDIYVLNNNPINLDLLKVKNNIIEFNLDNKNNQIFAYNSNGYSYIYSNSNHLNKINFYKNGIYNIDYDNIILSNDELQINTGKYEYYFDNINTFVNKSNDILSDYNTNINLFGYTTKYKASFYSNLPNLIDDFSQLMTNNIIISSQNETNEFNIGQIIDPNNENIEIIERYPAITLSNILIKDTDYLTIDIPIQYEYKSFINTDLKYHKTLCPISLENIQYEIFKEEQEKNEFAKYIYLDYNRSFIHDNNIKSIKNIENNTYILEECRISLYFDIDQYIYDLSYENQNKGTYNFKLDIIVSIDDKSIKYSFECFVDIMNKQFKKLYHDYNYGFNYDKHGECIGLLLLPKYNMTDTIKYNKYILQNHNNNTISYLDVDINNISYLNLDNDIFINYSDKDISNILINSSNSLVSKRNLPNDIPNFNNIWLFGNYLNNGNSNQGRVDLTISRYTINSDLIQDLKVYNKDSGSGSETPGESSFSFINSNKINTNDWNYLLNNNEFASINEFSNLSRTMYVMNNSFIDNGIGTIKRYRTNSNNDVNNDYILSRKNTKNIFNNIYNTRKSGLVFGDLYVPCLKDYLLTDLFSVERYLSYNIYKQYLEFIRKSNYLVSCQFTKYNNTIYQYSLINSNLKLLDNTLNSEEGKTYVWPLFTIPNYSIINSNDYFIMFDKEENCECIDYYINNDKKENIFINFRSYVNDIRKFIILDENYKSDYTIYITNINLIDEVNNIYQFRIINNNDVKKKIFYIVYNDTNSYMNNLEQDKNSNQEYRILCKVYIKK